MERTDIEQWKGKEVARLLALVETERRYYQEMVASLPAALVVLSSERLIVSANRAFRNYFGLRPEEFRRRHIESILPSTDLIEKIREAHMAGASQQGFYHRQNDRLFAVSVIPLRNWDDEAEVETLVMIFDVTDVPAAQETPAPAAEPAAATHFIETSVEAPVETGQEPAEPLIQSEPEAAEVTAPEPEPEPAPEPDSPVPSVLDNTLPAVAWRAEASTLVFTSVTGDSEHLLGFATSHWQTASRFFAERIDMRDRDAVLARYRTVTLGGPDTVSEFRVLTATGTSIWCREIVRMVESGLLTGVLIPLGARKALEQSRVVAERHAALQHLAAQLAHDLNNPLMIITGYAEEMLNSLTPSDPRRGDIQQILDATHRMSGITANLLNFTRPIETKIESVELSHLINDLSSSIERAVEGPEMLYLGTQLPVWAAANRAYLSEIILTLVHAVHPAGTERNRVAVACGTMTLNEPMNEPTMDEPMESSSLAAGTYATVVVRNDGPGLDTAARSSIFESIISKDRSGQDQGVSQSLARAYRLVRNWGGDIQVTSDRVQGSVFTVLLPLTQPVVEEHVPEPAAPVTEEPAEKTAPQSILVVDDEPGIRALVAKILRREGYEVLEAGNATEAYEVAAQREGVLDLLLTDVMLPDESGRQVAERLRVQRPDVHVLYISGFTDDQSIRAGEFPPGSRFLQKPFTVGALVNKVRETLAAE